MSIADSVISWLATYVVHSTLLLAAAALLSSRLRSDAWRELLWKSALVGALVSATLPTALGYSPLLGRIVLEPPRSAVVSTAARDAELRGGDRAAAADAPPAKGGAADAGMQRSIMRDPAAERGGASPSRSGAIPWRLLLLGGWLSVALLLLTRVALGNARLFALLRGRRAVVDGPLPAVLAELRRRAGYWTPVRLSASSACPTPLALGRREICVPERFITELDDEQQRAALAHELAHLARRDPLWHFAASLIAAVFFFQPLNRIAWLRIRAAAEHLCDDWAARQTGSPLGLARCLADVASWVGSASVTEATLAMAEGGSPLLHRVQRLTAWRDGGARGGRLRPLAGAALVAFVALAAPAVSQTRSGDEPPRVTASSQPEGEQQDARTKDIVIRHPDPSEPLQSRWGWAARRADGVAWVAWEVAEASRGAGTVASNSVGAGPHRDDAPTLARILGEYQSPGRAALLFRIDGPVSDSPDATRIRALGDALDLDGAPLIWLGNADADESLALLGRMYAAESNENLRAELAAAIALHDAPAAVVTAVDAILRADRSPRVRGEAVQWLARFHARAGEVVPLLLRVAQRDTAEKVQLEALDALTSLMGTGAAGARAAVIELAETHPSWAVRSEAAQALSARD